MYKAKIYVDQQGDNNLQLDTKFVKKHPVVPDLLDSRRIISPLGRVERRIYSKQNRFFFF